MQTFLPYKDFAESAKVLDMKRLGKQRVEVLQILQTLAKGDEAKGWKNHPAVLMWRGYEKALVAYGLAICNEWKSRGYRDSCTDKILSFDSVELEIVFPDWLGDENLHAAHRSNLLRKAPEYYAKYSWKEPADIPYVWPTHKNNIGE